MSLATVAVACPVALRSQTSAPTRQAFAETVRVIAPQELESMFPSTVYFRGKVAPIQWRNASAVRFPGQSVFFAGLIDSSGYASALQETYQMYVLTEQPVLVGDRVLPAGAYGAGFVGERFVVMDIGGHTVAEGQTKLDEHLARPRPLQFLEPTATDVRLYLGRRWVRIALQPAQ